jgi:hypothetical protein
MEQYENCLRGEYNADAEAVRFIVQIYQLGGEGALRAIKDNWEKIAAAWAIIAAIGKYGGESAVVKFLSRILSGVAGAVINVLFAFILGLGLAAALLAITAAVECLPRLSE